MFKKLWPPLHKTILDVICEPVCLNIPITEPMYLCMQIKNYFFIHIHKINNNIKY